MKSVFKSIGNFLRSPSEIAPREDDPVHAAVQAQIDHLRPTLHGTDRLPVPRFAGRKANAAVRKRLADLDPIVADRRLPKSVPLFKAAREVPGSQLVKLESWLGRDFAESAKEVFQVHALATAMDPPSRASSTAPSSTPTPARSVASEASSATASRASGPPAIPQRPAPAPPTPGPFVKRRLSTIADLSFGSSSRRLDPSPSDSDLSARRHPDSLRTNSSYGLDIDRRQAGLDRRLERLGLPPIEQPDTPPMESGAGPSKT